MRARNLLPVVVATASLQPVRPLSSRRPCRRSRALALAAQFLRVQLRCAAFRRAVALPRSPFHHPAKCSSPLQAQLRRLLASVTRRLLVRRLSAVSRRRSQHEKQRGRWRWRCTRARRASCPWRTHGRTAPQHRMTLRRLFRPLRVPRRDGVYNLLMSARCTLVQYLTAKRKKSFCLFRALVISAVTTTTRLHFVSASRPRLARH